MKRILGAIIGLLLGVLIGVGALRFLGYLDHRHWEQLLAVEALNRLAEHEEPVILPNGFHPEWDCIGDEELFLCSDWTLYRREE